MESAAEQAKGSTGIQSTTPLENAMLGGPAEANLLLEAFQTFTKASDSLECYPESSINALMGLAANCRRSSWS